MPLGLAQVISYKRCSVILSPVHISCYPFQIRTAPLQTDRDMREIVCDENKGHNEAQEEDLMRRNTGLDY